MGLRDAPGLVNRKFGKLYSALREPFIEPVAILDFEDPPCLFSSFNYEHEIQAFKSRAAATFRAISTGSSSGFTPMERCPSR